MRESVLLVLCLRGEGAHKAGRARTAAHESHGSALRVCD